MCIPKIEIINNLFNNFQYLQAHLKTTIEESKKKYYSRLSGKLSLSKIP